MGKSFKSEKVGQLVHQFFLDSSTMKTFIAILALFLALILVEARRSDDEVSSDNIQFMIHESFKYLDIFYLYPDS